MEDDNQTPGRKARQHWERRYRDAGEQASPSAFLVRHADRIQGRVLDLACGAGRNALFLARRGAVVDAIDVAFGALARLMQAARAEGLPLRAVQANLEAYRLPRDCYDAVINFRYLQRSLFEEIRQAVKPGGLVVFETFLVDQARVGHPRNPDFLLAHGELRAAFAGFDLLDYREGYVEEPGGGAYLASMLARR